MYPCTVDSPSQKKRLSPLEIRSSVLRRAFGSVDKQKKSEKAVEEPRFLETNLDEYPSAVIC